MKKIIGFSILLSAIFVLFSLMLNVPDVIGNGKATMPNPTGAMPDTIFSFLKATCMDCHSDNGSGIAKGKLNLSKWDGMTVEKQRDEAQDICKVLTKGTMPKKGWLKKNPTLEPKKTDIEKVCQWSESLKK